MNEARSFVVNDTVAAAAFAAHQLRSADTVVTLKIITAQLLGQTFPGAYRAKLTFIPHSQQLFATRA